VALVADHRVGGPHGGQGRRGAGRHRDVDPPGQPQEVLDVAGPPAVPVGDGGDPDEVDAGPAEQHRQRAGVVGVATQVGVEVDQHAQALSPGAR
jgi:hypothetical protein